MHIAQRYNILFDVIDLRLREIGNILAGKCTFDDLTRIPQAVVAKVSEIWFRSYKSYLCFFTYASFPQGNIQVKGKFIGSAIQTGV